MNDDVNEDIPAGNEALLRQLFQDALLHEGELHEGQLHEGQLRDSQFHVNQDEAKPVVPDELFVQQIMQDVIALQRRQLLFSIMPAVLSFVGVVLLISWMLTPYLSQLPAFFSQLPSLLAVGLSGTWSTLSSSFANGGGNLIPILVLLLALLLPTLVDRLPRILRL